MRKLRYKFSETVTDYYFESGITHLKKIVRPANAILLTDENVYNAHKSKFRGWDVIVLKAGEEYKVQSAVDAIIEHLIKMEATRDTMLVGIGGGVVTDITGYTASIYMRGIRFGFIPTSVLSMVDAAIGGKNGVDVGVYKNMVGAIRQPAFILFDPLFLSTLPQEEWENGFAEIIKHACILDTKMFSELEKKDLRFYQSSKRSIAELVKRNALLKSRVVQRDEFEKKERRILNFGHTLGHALENQYELQHGQAISLGMVMAARISEKLTGFKDADRVERLLDRYNLPCYAGYNKEKVFSVLKMDKKRQNDSINFVLLNKIGKAEVKPISLSQLKLFLKKF